MKLYKIRNEEGQYSNGGMFPDFSKTGKVWRNIGFVKNHLNQFIGRFWPYKNCVIVEWAFNYSPTENTLDIDKIYESLKRKKATKK